MKIRIIHSSIIPKILKVGAITLYPLILFADNNPSKKLINHELIHVEQIKRIGVIRFYLSYVLYYFAGRLERKSHLESYMSIPFEVEAYKNE